MPKRYLTGGGNNLKNQKNSIWYIFKISHLAKFYIKKFFKRKKVYRWLSILEKKHTKASCQGAILIEFAVSMPILIILLFYSSDLVRIKRYYSQTEFVAQQLTNIIQNISKKRDDKRITLTDIKYAFCSAYLSIYPGTSRFWIGAGTELIHRPEILVTYVKGEADGTASSKWALDVFTNDSHCDSPIKCGYFYPSDHTSFITRGNKTKVTPSAIHPMLKIAPGEIKIIIECVMFYGYDFKDNNGYEPHSINKAFNCLLADIKSKTDSGNFFISTVIFTPKPGLFTETAPL